MSKQFIGPAVLATILLVSGCTSVPPQQVGSVDMATARQTVKIYDVIPQYGTPIEQITATACDGNGQTPTEELKASAMDQLIALTSQRGGNGLAQQSCSTEGISFSCWSSAICTGMALNVAPPPPPPPPPKRAKSKPKKKL